jgi:hypothetical protein
MSDNRFPSALVWLIILAVIVGAALGMDIAGWPPAAHADQGDSSNWYLDYQRQLELEHLRQLRQAELAALDAKSRQELALALERHQRELELIERRAQLMNDLLPLAAGVVLLAGLIASVGLAYWLVCLGRSRLLAAQEQVNWRDEYQRAEAVRLAREAERQWRGNGHRLARFGQAL